MADLNLIAWASPFVTLIGWFIVNEQNNVREVRKEARSAADSAKRLAREASQLGCDYWLGDQDANAWKIKAQLEELELEIIRITSPKQSKSLLIKYADLVDAITGDDSFDGSQRKILAKDNSIYKNIAMARQNLLQDIETQYFEHHVRRKC